MPIDLDQIRELETERLEVLDKLVPLAQHGLTLLDVPTGEPNIEATEKAIRDGFLRLTEINNEIWQLRGVM